MMAFLLHQVVFCYDWPPLFFRCTHRRFAAAGYYRPGSRYPPTKGPAKSSAKPAPTPARPVAASTPAAPAAAQPEAAGPAEAPHLVTLAGTIVGPDGQPRPGVCVFPTTSPRLLAVTDARGTFQLQVPAATALHLQAEYVGLGSTRFDVDGQHPQAIRIVLGQ